jgi:hypothetical protein
MLCSNDRYRVLMAFSRGMSHSTPENNVADNVVRAFFAVYVHVHMHAVFEGKTQS